MMLTKLVMMYLIAIQTVLSATTNCKEFQTRYQIKKKIVTEKIEACYDDSGKIFKFISPNCLESEKCRMINKLFDEPLHLSKIFTTIGSPGFNLCHGQGWSPRITEIKLDNWKKITVCYSFNQNEFVNADYLLDLYLSELEKK